MTNLTLQYNDDKTFLTVTGGREPIGGDYIFWNADDAEDMMDGIAGLTIEQANEIAAWASTTVAAKKGN